MKPSNRKAEHSLPRFFVGAASPAAAAIPVTLETGQLLQLDLMISHQILQVLRLRAGQRVILLNGQGTAFQAILRQFSDRVAICEIVEPASCAPEPLPELTLFAAILKGERQDWLIQKAVELGVYRVQPIITERSIAKSHSSKTARWLRIAQEAAEQSERSRVPQILEPLPVMSVNWKEATALVCTERQGTNFLTNLTDANGKIAIFVGPEGGFAPKELHWLIERGGKAVSLGARILRAETAAIAAMAAAMALLDWPVTGAIPREN
ncbi:MAG: 16S rRNA (uracil(1498)-N(3))-methyltransferase [Cyanobacteria bacterium NC_groundwater_1444_Ag_S-0.65um_54_12]|nr:16S rRNA (uracil(1498)-N(3))-methyltransferase [Cyanobacteria bacterium NC_groundwater_1444_Ag_S-0.65um_54_12]